MSETPFLDEEFAALRKLELTRDHLAGQVGLTEAIVRAVGSPIWTELSDELVKLRATAMENAVSFGIEPALSREYAAEARILNWLVTRSTLAAVELPNMKQRLAVMDEEIKKGQEMLLPERR